MSKATSKKWYHGGLAFACQGCGGCCSGPEEGYVWVTAKDIKKMAELLGLNEADFRNQYVRRIGRRYSLKEKEPNKDCVLLSDTNGNAKQCLVYSIRPVQCRTWPFWKENLSSRRAWDYAAQNCTGLNRGKWFSPEQIQAAATGDGASCDGGREIADVAVQWIEANVDNQDYHAVVEELYTMLDEQLAAANPTCDNCGKCCDFDEFDHRLYATTLEMLYFVRGVRMAKKAKSQEAGAKGKGVCPYQRPAGCSIREFRPAGCRIFYCHDLPKGFQHELTELVLTSLRGLHEQFGAVYYYGDLREWLARLRR